MRMRKQVVPMKGYYLNILLGDVGLGDLGGDSQDHCPGGASLGEALGWEGPEWLVWSPGRGQHHSGFNFLTWEAKIKVPAHSRLLGIKSNRITCQSLCEEPGSGYVLFFIATQLPKGNLHHPLDAPWGRFS